MPLLKIKLSKLNRKKYLAPYGKNGALVPLPGRMAYLHPDAKAAIEKAMSDGLKLYFTDVYRSMDSQLLARKTKRGTAVPGYSAHNFGLAIDLDIDRTLRANKMSESHFRHVMCEAYGWPCFRDIDDMRKKSERWHYTFLTKYPGEYGVKRAIEAAYMMPHVLDAKTIQNCLAALKLYSGGIDGNIGPLTRQALELFKRTWQPQSDAELHRMLLVASAEKEIV